MQRTLLTAVLLAMPTAAFGDPATRIEVRAAAFYAPDLHSAGGRQAKAAMERVALGRTLRCVAGRRSYDRMVAQCSINGVSIGGLMRREGVASGDCAKIRATRNLGRGPCFGPFFAPRRV